MAVARDKQAPSTGAKYPLTAGAITGCIEICITYPLEYVKTMVQLTVAGHSNPASQAKLAFNSPLECVRHTYKTHGVKGFYKGLSSWLFFAFPRNSSRFATYEWTMKALSSTNSWNINHALVAGGVAGIAEAALVITPMQSLQVKLAHDQEKLRPRFRGFFHAVYLIGKEDRFRGLFDGLEATVIKGCINNAIRFSLYRELKLHLLKDSENSELSMLQSYLAGACSGGVSAFFTHPLDVVRTNMQGLDKARFNGVTDCLKTVIKDEGLKGLYKGFAPRAMRVCTEIGLHFMLYELINRKLEQTFGDSYF